MKKSRKCPRYSRDHSLAVGSFVAGTALLVMLPVQSVFATSSIANRVMAFCAPSPTVPDVNSCSACHSTTNNRGPSDLTTAGFWALNGQDSNFCPGSTPPPSTPAPTPAPVTPGTGMGMGSGSSSGSSMGRGIGGSSSADDDDDGEDDDDDDVPVSAPAL